MYWFKIKYVTNIHETTDIQIRETYLVESLYYMGWKPYFSDTNMSKNRLNWLIRLFQVVRNIMAKIVRNKE